MVVCSDYPAVCFWLLAAADSIVGQFQALLTQFITWTPKQCRQDKTILLSLEVQHEDAFSCHSGED